MQIVRAYSQIEATNVPPGADEAIRNRHRCAASEGPLHPDVQQIRWELAKDLSGQWAIYFLVVLSDDVRDRRLRNVVKEIEGYHRRSAARPPEDALKDQDRNCRRDRR